MARPPAKYRCFEHKMTFKSGTGFAAHMRAPRYHPKGSLAPAFVTSLSPRKTYLQIAKETLAAREVAAARTNGPAVPDVGTEQAKVATQPLPQTEGTHMQSALKIIGEKIANTEAELRHLRFQQGHITEALASEYIPF